MYCSGKKKLHVYEIQWGVVIQPTQCHSSFSFLKFSSLLALLFYLCSCFPLSAGEFYLGVSKVEDRFFVKKKDAPIASGALAGETAFSPSIGYKTELSKLWGNWIFFWDFSYGEFQASKQEIVETAEDGHSSSRISDLGTKVQAKGVSIAPNLLVTTNSSQKEFFFFGVGLGIGYSAAKGDVYLNEAEFSTSCGSASTDDEIKNNCEKHSFDFSGWGLGGVVSVGYQGAGWSFMAYGAGPNFDQQGYTYTTNFAHLVLNVEF